MVEWLKEHPVLYNKKLKDFGTRAKNKPIMERMGMNHSDIVRFHPYKNNESWNNESWPRLLRLETATLRRNHRSYKFYLSQLH
jgi:hypothetical protein